MIRYTPANCNDATHDYYVTSCIHAIGVGGIKTLEKFIERAGNVDGTENKYLSNDDYKMYYIIAIGCFGPTGR